MQYQDIRVETKGIGVIPVGKLELYTWNINYGGVGKNVQLPYNRLSKEEYDRNIEGIIYQLTTLNKLDFILLQEVDIQAKRSLNDRQADRIKASFKEYASAFAVNYKVPGNFFSLFTSSAGEESGLLSLSRYAPTECKRYPLSNSTGILHKSAYPEPCIILTRYKVCNGKCLTLINIHNTANSGLENLKFIKQLIEEEYKKGNYAIAGGDWGASIDIFNSAGFVTESMKTISDPKFPTARSTQRAYTKGETPTSTNDFFVITANIKPITANTLNNDFYFSAHQATGMIVELENEHLPKNGAATQ